MNNIIYNDDEVANIAKRILSPYKIQPRYVPEERQEKSDKTAVNDLHKRFLMAVHVSPYPMPLKEIYKSAGFPLSTGHRIGCECEQLNLLNFIELPLGKGRPQKFCTLTELAYQLLSVKRSKFGRRGGESEKHLLIKRILSHHLKTYNPIIEYNNIDVAFKIDGKLICIEIELNDTHHITENIIKDFKTGAYKVFVCCERKLLNKVHEIVSQLPEHIKNNTEACLISELLKKSPDEIVNR